MHREKTETLRADLAHGHSRLTWLMDELEAHLKALEADPSGTEFILDELQSYWSEFRESLEEHIVEEEDELFPLARLHATTSDLAELGELQAEHAQLLVMLIKVGNDMSLLETTDGEERTTSIHRVLERAEALRARLSAHSRHERQFLREVDRRISEACLT